MGKETPMQELFIKFGHLLPAIENEFLTMEKELLKSFYLKGDSNGCGCYNYSTDEDAEEYFSENFPKNTEKN